MNDQKMKKLIKDQQALVFVHDILSIREKKEDFYDLNLIQSLYEHHALTIAKSLKRTFKVLLTFVIIIMILKNSSLLTYQLFTQYAIMGIISIFYGILLVSCKEEIYILGYQLSLKKACVYALEHYTYDEYVVFLDKYLSEKSTTDYLERQHITKFKA